MDSIVNSNLQDHKNIEHQESAARFRNHLGLFCTEIDNTGTHGNVNR